MVPRMLAWMNSDTMTKNATTTAWLSVAGTMSAPSRILTECQTEKQYW